jgi:hypothetical protein
MNELRSVMFTAKKIPAYKRLLEGELEYCLKSLRAQVIGSDEHKKVMDAVVTLHGLMDKDPSGVSKDAMAMIAGNLLGIILIIKHEHVNVITSKALGLLLRPRITAL